MKLEDLNSMEPRDLELLFEREVLGIEPEKIAFASSDGGKSGALFESSRWTHNDYGVSRDAVTRFCAEHPAYEVHYTERPRAHYSREASAVLPHLEKLLYQIDHWPTRPEGYQIRVIRPNRHVLDRLPLAVSADIIVRAETFARAAVLALIQRHQVRAKLPPRTGK